MYIFFNILYTNCLLFYNTIFYLWDHVNRIQSIDMVTDLTNFINKFPLLEQDMVQYSTEIIQSLYKYHGLNNFK